MCELYTKVTHEKSAEARPPPGEAGSKAQGRRRAKAARAARNRREGRPGVSDECYGSGEADGPRYFAARTGERTGAISDSPGAGSGVLRGHRHEGDAPGAKRPQLSPGIFLFLNRRGRKAKRPGGFEASGRGRKAPARKRASRAALHGQRDHRRALPPAVSCATNNRKVLLWRELN